MNALNALLPAAAAAAGLSAWAGMHPRSQLFGPVTYNVPDGCALTFDDGPNPDVTPRLLRLLDQHGVKATFFLLGKHVRKFPGVVAEIASHQHQIGNHTDTHRSLLFLGRDHILEEIRRCEEAIHAAAGRPSAFIRPPFGFRGPNFASAVRSANFRQVVMWSVNGRDWKPQSGYSMTNRLRRVGQGDIVLLHDGDHRASKVDRSHMLQALEFWLPRWLDSGLKFVTP
jgi:peptidoglycan-N-acetylglucosamine deacetylase